MSIRILRKDHAESVDAMQWLHPGEAVVEQEYSPSPTQLPAHGDAAEILLTQQRRIHELEDQLETRCREAFQNGQSSGAAAALERAEKQLEPVMARMAAAVDYLTGIRRKVRAEAEEDAVRLSLAVARKVIHREISIDPDALLGLVKAALQRIDSRELHRLRMHPEDIARIERHLETLECPRVLRFSPTRRSNGVPPCSTPRAANSTHP